jgi:membrane associated rhomboid family serine protease
MDNITAIGLIIILVNLIVTYNGLNKLGFMEKYSFKVGKILLDKEYKRLVTSGFLHGGWVHFIFNMITFYFFSHQVELTLGPLYFLSIYILSLIGGNLFALCIHRKNASYSAVGASGAISGVLFSSIALYPSIGIGFFFLPFYIPGWLFGLLYVLYSIYGIKSRRDNIGHEAHLGGGIIGMIVTIAIVPQILSTNLLPILAVLLPTLVFLFIVINKPAFIPTGGFFKPNHRFLTIDQKYNAAKREREKKIDKILDKINKQGFESLSKQEKELLEELSKKV